MEDDVGIYDDEGLQAYAAYFRDALLNGLKLDPGKNVSTLSSTSSFISLIIQYPIERARFDGILKVYLIKNYSIIIFNVKLTNFFIDLFYFTQLLPVERKLP
jgi:hypothetical protein